MGTAPGLVVPPGPSSNGGPTVVVLPGPPRELQEMWPAAVEAETLRAAIASATRYEQRTLRLYGIPESEIAETLRAAEASGPGLEGLEITTCLRRGELEVVTRFEPSAADTYAAFEDVVRERHGETLFSTDGATVDEQVAELLQSRGWSIATAESCTGGLLAGRLTDLAGSSAYVLGGLVVYSNEAKTALAGVDPVLIERVGAVSTEVAEALADGARSRLGAEVGVGITGVAGPGGGTATKPVGLVCSRSRGRTARGSRDLPAARRPRGRPRPLDDRGDAPRAPAAARRGRSAGRVSARLFAALELPAPVRDALGAFGRAAAADDFALRAVGDDALHVTLAFLGHRPLDDIEPACEAVRAAAGPAPALALGDVLWLAPRRPHVLTVEVRDADGALFALQERVGRGAGGRGGLRARPPALSPAVTVARVRHGAAPRRSGLPEAPRAEFAGAAVVLYRSWLGGGPARYEALERVAL